MRARRSTRAVARRVVIAAGLSAACVAECHGEAASATPFTVQGFGTVAASYNNQPDLEYRRTTAQAHGVRGGEIDFASDSALGVQLTTALHEKLDLVAQGISRQDARGSWTPRLTQGFLRFNPTPDLRVRLGRIGYDAYLLAESPDVGYSYLPLRPAPEFFGLFSTDSLDGADLSAARPLGSGIGSARLFWGASRGDHSYLENEVAFSSSRVQGLQLDYSIHSWLVRAVGVEVSNRRAADVAALVDALRATGVRQSLELADALSSGAHTLQAWQVAVAYDGRPFQGQLMFTRAQSSMVTAPKVNSGLAVLGYRYRHVTPYLSFARVQSTADLFSTGLPDSPQYASLNAAARLVQIAAQATQRTQSAGLRFDIAPRLDLKFQIDRVQAHTSNLVFDHAATPRDRADLTLLSLSADFVF